MDLEEMYRCAKREVFRLEILEEYRVPGEWEQFQEFLKGGTQQRDEDFEALCVGIRNGRKEGKIHRRIRVLPEKPSDYLRFEIGWFYGPRIEAGEEILVVAEKVFKGICPDQSKDDFYLFDDARVAVLRYSGTGEFLSVDEPSDSGPYKKLRDELLRQAVPLRMFLLANPNYFQP